MAIPGSIVGVGKLVTPGGAQGPSGGMGPPGSSGPQGNPGPIGPVTNGYMTKTAAYTLTVADSAKYIICSGGNWTLTLPASAVGLLYQVRNDMGISGTTGTITLQPSGGTIDGKSMIPLLPQQECTLLSDGTNWRTYGLKREVILGTQDITSSTVFGSVLLPVGYRHFELLFDGLVPTANDYMLGQLSNNGGSTWIATGYYHGVCYNTATTVAFFNNENVLSFYLSANVQAAVASSPGQSKLSLYPGDATRYPDWILSSGVRSAGNFQLTYNGWGMGLGGAGPINALKYQMAASNIASCFLTVKGVV